MMDRPTPISFSTGVTVAHAAFPPRPSDRSMDIGDSICQRISLSMAINSRLSSATSEADSAGWLAATEMTSGLSSPP